MRLMGPIMASTGEMIGILCHGLIATRLCKLADLVFYVGPIHLGHVSCTSMLFCFCLALPRSRRVVCCVA